MLRTPPSYLPLYHSDKWELVAWELVTSGSYGERRIFIIESTKLWCKAYDTSLKIAIWNG